MQRRHPIIALALVAGVSGELLAAVSMTRIAGPVAVEAGQVTGLLGFPYELRWTLFAVVSVAGWVGAILWTSSEADARRRGPWLNLPAATLAGVIVGADHAGHAGPGWAALGSFLLGPAITLTSSLMLHVIAIEIARDETPAPTVQQHVQARAQAPVQTPVIRSGEPENSPEGNRASRTYEPDEGDATTADAPTPPAGVPSVTAGRTAVEAQIEWINTQDVEPTAERIAAEFGIAPRTAFRRLAAARERVAS